MSDDSTLMHSYADQNSEEAFRLLVERHFALVYTAALRCSGGRHAVAQELSQQVFTLMAKQAHRLKTHPLLPGWLYHCTRHVAAKHGRSEARRTDRERKAAMLYEPAEATPRCVDWDALRPQLDIVLDDLSEKDRNAIILRFLGNQPHAEVARALGVSEDAARMRVERALDKMRSLLEKRGLRSAAETLTAFLAAQGAFAAPSALVLNTTQASLAAATLGSASIPLVLFSMTMTHKATVAACLACLLATGFASFEYNKASEAAAAQQLAAKREALLSSANQALEMRVRSLEAAQTGQPSRSASVPSTATSSAGTKSQLEIYADFLIANPEYSELSKKVYLASLPLKYRLLYRRLGLTPDQISSFESLLAEQHQLSEDMLVAARTRGLPLEDAQTLKLRLKEQDALVQRQKELLGDEGWKKLVEYSKTEPARVAVLELSTALTYTASPLTLDQMDKLEELIAKNTPKAEISGLRKIVKPADWTAVEAGASAFLSQEQHAELRLLSSKRQYEAGLNAIRMGNAEVFQRSSSARGTP